MWQHRWKEVCGRMDTCICMAGSLCPPETIMKLLIDYIPIQNKNFKKREKERCLNSGNANLFPVLPRQIRGAHSSTPGSCLNHLFGWNEVETHPQPGSSAQTQAGAREGRSPVFLARGEEIRSTSPTGEQKYKIRHLRTLCLAACTIWRRKNPTQVYGFSGRVHRWWKWLHKGINQSMH